MKTILDISKEEFVIKFEKFIQDLGIQGSVINQYDLYSAIYQEYTEAQDKLKELNELND